MSIWHVRQTIKSSSAAFTDDPQDSFGSAHLAHLPVLSDRRHLPPFAMWPAFPTSDYYGGSVTIGLAPHRPSHVLTQTTSERAVGAPFGPFQVFATGITHGAYLIS